MPSTKLSQSIGATTVVENVLSGTDFEFLPWPALVSISATGSATGLILDLKADNEDLATQVVPNIAAAAGRVIVPDDTIIAQEPVLGGRRMKVRCNNPTGGALTLNLLVEIDKAR